MNAFVPPGQADRSKAVVATNRGGTLIDQLLLDGRGGAARLLSAT